MAGDTDELFTRPRRRRFPHPEAEVVWAGAMTLDVADQHRLLRKLAVKLSAFPAEEATTAGKRVRLAVAALWTAYDLLGASPSVRAYKELLTQFPDLDLPKEATIRRWLGGGWDHCVKRALLPTPSNGDFVTKTLDADFDEAEILKLILVCGDDLGRSPTLDDFQAWVLRPDVEVRFPRRPLSYGPLGRFGGWAELLERAIALALEEGRSTPLLEALPRTTNFERDEMIAGLREVAARIAERAGESPTGRLSGTLLWPEDYKKERAVLHELWLSQGVRRVLASSGTISRAFGNWNNALVAVGIEPVRALGQNGGPGGGRRSFSRAAKAEALQEAFEAIGNPFTKKRFIEWRRAALKAARAHGENAQIPGIDVIETEWGGWTKACVATLSAYDAQTRKRRGDLQTRKQRGDARSRKQRGAPPSEAAADG